ncbi:hypothetical protein [Paraburkholderia sp.]|jgi:hypothetical protein|uniref:hypothetical protein n=1 Tax=Paraburkholderia sp. TaxID=1926495 RepID=UPI000EFD5180|nr:hypothetical protein [Paraburkholderia sp.]
MEKLAAQRLNVCEASQRRALKAEGKRHWTIGIAITLVAIALFAIAAVLAVSSVRANNTLCLQQVANDEHTSLDAFFQNPAQQDALVEAATLCSR